MDPELRSVLSRYSVVGIVLAASVIWAARYTTEAIAAQGGTSVDALAPQPPPTLTGSANAPASPSDAQAAAGQGADPPRAPSLAALLVTRDGTTRVDCAAACRLEAYCDLRDVPTCTAASCDGDLRRALASDLIFARADTCVQAAAAPCEESCARRGVCANNHTDNARCTDACLKQASRDPPRAYREARCVLETGCADLGRCTAPGP